MVRGTAFRACSALDLVHVLAESPTSGPSVDGVVGRMTYLGNARVYTVKLDWMEVEVREENRPGAELHAPGAEVTVSWDPQAISVVADS